MLRDVPYGDRARLNVIPIYVVESMKTLELIDDGSQRAYFFTQRV